MDIFIAVAAVVGLVGVRVWAGAALAEFIDGLPADQRGIWTRALSRSDL